MAEGIASRSLAIVARSIWVLVTALVVIVALGVAALTWIDRPSGHAFLVGQLDRLKLANGIGFGVGRIEGSIFGELRVHDLTVSDQHGVFVTAPLVDLDWRPRDWLANTLTVRSARAGDVRVLRLPDLKPTDNPNILPDFDIFIGKLRIDRLALDAAVAGKPHVIAVAGNADIRSGRALVDLDARALTGGDTLRLKLDAEPDRDRFDVDAVIDAPRGGAIAGLAGLDVPLSVRVTGDGKWSAWQGKAVATTGSSQLASLALTAAAGHFTANGTIAPAPLLGPGPAARLTSPAMTVNADVRLADRIATTRIALASPALTATAAGRLDFANEKLDGVSVDAQLRDPRALSPQLNGRDIRLVARVAGTFAAPLVDYVLTATQLSAGTTIVTNLRATGVAQPGATPMLIPVNATASRITGVNPAADALLTNVRIETRLRIGDGMIRTETLSLRSDRLSATGNVQFATATGQFTGAVNANLPNYPLPGTGVANITADLRVTGSADRGVHVAGTGRAAFTRIDNPAVLEQLGGMPVISTGIDIAPDLSMTFRDARVVAPALSLTGNGTLSKTGVINFAATGNSQSFGPASFVIKGPLDRIEAEFRFASPALGIGLHDVIARIVPVGVGWSFDATGNTLYGPIKLRGSILTGPGKPLTVTLDQLAAAGLTAKGSVVRTAAGPFAGQILVTGPGINGSAQLTGSGSTQRVDVLLSAKDARIALATPVTIASGSAQAMLLFPSGGAPSVNGKFALSDLRRGDARVASADGTVAFANGNGTAQIRSKGTAGAPFTLNSVALLAGDRLSVSADGSLGGRPLKLEHAAELTRSTTGWTLAPVVLVTPEGRTQLSGSFGKDLALHAQIDHLGLGLSSLFIPTIDLTGHISGTIDFNYRATDALPTGSANLRVTGLSRASAGKSAMRIDLGINAALAGGKASARMVIARDGRIEGRAQAQLAVIPGGRADPILTRLLAAPLFGQLRWSGPAQAIWQFAGVDAIDVRGPMTVAVDMGAVLGDPSFSGSVTADGARIEGTSIGLVLDRVVLASRFTGSQLEITNFTAGAGKDGTIAGSGKIDLSAVRNFPTDIKLDLKNAQLINRDDIRGSATGAVRITNGADGAKIAGKLEIDRARINLGVNSTAEVPVLRVTEINGDTVNRPTPAASKPTVWQLDLAVTANNRIEVRGMGLDSEWSADLRVTGRADAPSIVGPIRLVRGDYDFAGKRFRITRGDVRFTGGFPPDPLINIVAENTSSSLTATLTITGTAQHPQIAFSSVPALPEDEVLSRVLFGESVTNLSAPEALQLAGALATLRGGSGGLNPINAVRKGLGIDRLRILPADTVTGRKTSIAAGQYIGDRVYVEVTSDAQGYNATSVEVSLTRSLSILSQIATLGGTSISVRWKKDY